MHPHTISILLVVLGLLYTSQGSFEQRDAINRLKLRENSDDTFDSIDDGSRDDLWGHSRRFVSVPLQRLPHTIMPRKVVKQQFKLDKDNEINFSPSESSNGNSAIEDIVSDNEVASEKEGPNFVWYTDMRRQKYLKGYQKNIDILRKGFLSADLELPNEGLKYDNYNPLMDRSFSASSSSQNEEGNDEGIDSEGKILISKIQRFADGTADAVSIGVSEPRIGANQNQEACLESSRDQEDPGMLVNTNLKITKKRDTGLVGLRGVSSDVDTSSDFVRKIGLDDEILGGEIAGNVESSKGLKAEDLGDIESNRYFDEYSPERTAFCAVHNRLNCPCMTSLSEILADRSIMKRSEGPQSINTSDE